jgi:hypothetical protein
VDARKIQAEEIETVMFIERRINNTSQVVELWKCEWENQPGQPARKVFLEKSEMNNLKR